MQCSTSFSIPDPKIKNSKRFIDVPCGRCGTCQANRRSAWSFRLKQEFKVAKTALFVTLTYSDENLPVYDCSNFTFSKAFEKYEHGFNSNESISLCKKDLQDYIKRQRHYNSKHWNEQLRYYAVGEYGTNTSRPHYHLILFNLHLNCQKNIINTWNNGNIHIGQVTDASIHYISKYHVNRSYDKEPYRVPEFALMSRRPGIGYNYLYVSHQISGRKINYLGDNNFSWHKDALRNYVVNNGFKQSLPRYYRDKVFCDDKGLSLINAIKARQLQDNEYDRLEKLGYKYPILEHYHRLNAKSKRIKQKAQDGNTF